MIIIIIIIMGIADHPLQALPARQLLMDGVYLSFYDKVLNAWQQR